MSLGQRIKRLRKNQGLTQPEIAEKLGMGRSNFGHIENDRVVPTSATLQKIADILNTTTDYLLGRTENPESLSNMSEEALDEHLDSLIRDELTQGPLKNKNLKAEVKDAFRDWVRSCNIKDLRDVEVTLKIFALTVNQYVGRMSDEKLIQSGVKGFKNAYSTFDPSKGARFSTYLSRNIENQILMDAPKGYSNVDLTDREILTLAAHRVGYEEDLSEEELEKIKVALKIALSKD